jgi:DNA-directed RNA polymerase subunit RPC12/RpoP
MDVIFNCPKCDQELAVDSSGSGSEIDCPSCGESIVIPSPDGNFRPLLRTEPGPGAPGGGPINAIASSAAAKVQMHLRVPTNAAHSEVLIEKPLAPLEVAAKETDKTIKVKTIKHTDCIEVGHDKFDEFVSRFLNKVGESNVVSISPMTYTHIDIGSQKLLTDFAVMIVYRG